MPINLNFPQYIRTSLSQCILQNTDQSIIDKQMHDLNTLMVNRLNGIDYTHLAPVTRENIYYSLEYLKQQPLHFKNTFIENFLSDCMNAYTNAISCPGGAYERIGMYLANAASSSLSMDEDNEDYKDLIAIIGQDPRRLIPDSILDWYKLHKHDSELKFPYDMPDEARKSDLKAYLLEKYPTSNDLINEIMEKFDLTFDDASFTYGGRKTRKKKSKSIKSKSKSRTKKSRTKKSRKSRTKKSRKSRTKKSRTKKSRTKKSRTKKSGK